MLDFVCGGPADWAVDSESLGSLFLMTVLDAIQAKCVPTWKEGFVHWRLGITNGSLIRVKFSPLVLWLSHLVSKRN